MQGATGNGSAPAPASPAPTGSTAGGGGQGTTTSGQSSATQQNPTTAGGGDSAIKVYGNCTTPSVEPSEIVLACADENALLAGLHWTSWTAASATAVGTLEYNDCKPSCAEGHFHNVPGTQVTLTAPVQAGNGLVVWSRVQESPEPPGYATGPYHGGPQPLPTRPL
jgi:hypothetical protein